MIKRSFDFLASILGLIALAPIFFVIAVLVRLDSHGPILFRQERVGLCGKIFRICKFRTMVPDAESRGPQITVGTDARVTRVGAFLRQYKLDELPQLFNVLWGDMSLVGPRPEVPSYVACYPDDIRDIVLSVRPGITDRASIEYKDESRILGLAADPNEVYVEKVLPIKLAYCVDYVKTRTFRGDLSIIFATLIAIFR